MRGARNGTGEHDAERRERTRQGHERPKRKQRANEPETSGRADWISRQNAREPFPQSMSIDDSDGPETGPYLIRGAGDERQVPCNRPRGIPLDGARMIIRVQHAGESCLCVRHTNESQIRALIRAHGL